ncbi:MAG: hydroxymethylbilane synthase [Bacteriovoracaceae bacterium]|jgi:hydroxymethylbilane synthase|nr:hydroxymethylbilane synthase [Bacteriovoracaceae bacterium]
MSENEKYLIGTRGSLLAVTQCTLIKNEIESLTNKFFDLKLITTRGDQQTEKPLWQMDGKDFFTKELDHELLDGSIDLVVHSYKDLGSIRPDGIHLACVTKRNYSNDILLIKRSKIKDLNKLDEFIVGTSSPRRITNIESSLKPYLPNVKESLVVKTKMLRGNVNTRIEKLRSDEYDAIILAHAGIERLAHKEDSKKELIRLLDGLNYFILPQKVFPSCASQGSLGIEINEKNIGTTLDKTIKSVHCEKSFNEIQVERKAFNSYGGGCHLAVGIHAKTINDHLIKIEKGIHNDKEIYNLSIEDTDYSHLKGKRLFFAMGCEDKLINKDLLEAKASNKNLFVTSSYCFHAIDNNHKEAIFSAGNRTARKLVEKGFWVNGSAEGFGHEQILDLTKSEALKIMHTTDEYQVLSHDKADSVIGEVLPCYTRKLTQENMNIEDNDVFFWSSYFQYETYINKYPSLKDKIHTCGLGKTYTQFKNNNIKVTPVIDIKHLKELIK